MFDLKNIPPSLDDIRMWGRAIRSYRDATGAGMFAGTPIERLEPTLAGGLDALIPLYNAQHVRTLWDAGGIGGKDNPKSGWHLIDKYEKFSIALLSFKLRPRLFSGSKWLTEFSFWFQMDDITQYDKTIQIGGIGFSSTDTIAEVFLVVDRLSYGEWPLLSLEEAMRR